MNYLKKKSIECYRNAHGKGFYLPEFDMKTEVFKKLIEEANEFYGSHKTESFCKDSEQSEIADSMIVLLAYCGYMGYDPEKLLDDKMRFNEGRPYRHGKE